MKKLVNHLKFRLYQIFRIFNLDMKLSVPFLLLFIVMIVVELPSDYYYPPMFFMAALVFHCGRKDVPFLKKVFEQNWRGVVVLESALIYSVLLFGNIHYKLEVTGWAFYIPITAFAFFFPKTNIDPALKWNFIPDHLFEWKSFLRKNTWFSVAGYVILLLSSYHPGSLIIAGVFVMDYISDVFEPYESKEMFEMYFKKSSLKEKIRKNSLLFNALLLPVYVLALIINPFESLYVLYYFVFMNLYFLLIITRKYKLYHYKEKRGYYNIGVYIEFIFCSMTIIPALLVLKNNIKNAEQNIRTYVGD
ncbi:hypothetical protein JET18_16645 [Chryseobacterium sp. L7]|uniref:Prenyltransferase n=1 Tax=Chryseobacterium endalhagicum TaxID=2797638 RepID=A0ABS1QIP6_9FLAO|nr:hypothetical protein [Chryseobacterium endalhagicum]MBL1222483.1 hypothetical protein [Chryseobacterium endalhagicum]